ncbi:MAG: DNA repair protein RecO (recombination protein O) [Patiriisocius sp.]|jgi:DNA repair protein RecO (recombination protein O)
MKATDKGVFLHRLAYSETSLIVTFYTKSSGLRKFIFKGGKKKAHSLFPMSIGELSFYERKESDLLHLTSVDPATTHQFQFDPVKSTIAFFLAEVVRKCIQQGAPDEMLYNFVVDQISSLEGNEEHQYFPIHFLIDFSEVLGIQPYIEEDQAAYFNLDDGTFETYSKVELRVATGEAARLIKQRILSIETLDHSKEVREKALEVMLDYYRIHIPNFDTIDSYEIVKEILHS